MIKMLPLFFHCLKWNYSFVLVLLLFFNLFSEHLTRCYSTCAKYFIKSLLCNIQGL